ncbi:cupin domain-containing protein [Bacillus sp. RG28]|uniref:Acireductone dioxygenase n=1 Tax=Gottfriedia endophytica TaxID=2820819 RepID=A0A940NK76_9BACI|nr:cupin domain-containing protein [Gottfriedia endophytica]MBP0725965.1 cupin domain-containing protein [Gottfriedia endophytica]
MATIYVKERDFTITSETEVRAYLEEQNVIYENWNITNLPEQLREKFQLSDLEKEEILSVFENDIKVISERRGYLASDVISLSESTPNLEELLKNFNREHHHTDDEVRFIVSGHGAFIIQGSEGFFHVNLEPGDLISVPPNIRHYFTLADDRKVVAIRLFVTTEGWMPIYE